MLDRRTMPSNNSRDGFKVLMKLRPNEITDEKQPAFYLQRPKILTIYSCRYDSISNDVHLPYFKKPTSYPLDLNEGFDQFIFRQNKKTRLRKVEKFIMENEENILQPDAHTPSGSGQTQNNSKRKVILCQRGVLTDIMQTPYHLNASPSNNKTFCVTKYCGVFHMQEPETITNFTQIDTYHQKFMQYCFSDDPNSEPETDKPVDDNNQIFCIIKTSVKEFDLIYSAEIAGIVSDRKIENTHSMEEMNKLRFILTKQLNTNGIMGDYLNQRKCLRWWLQAYLAKTSDVCIGLRDQNGIVRTPVQIKRAEDIAKNRKWKPHVCIRFLHSVLKLVEKTMTQVDCPYTVYEFMYDSITRCIKLKVHVGKTVLSFLSDDYIRKCKQSASH
ncbi:decapping nuclease DXO homolog isoform X1 [Bactrocera neohumeralis]|uniref:decapping nuclease DXO homolog isoform X1 n=2 Tax=Bactrocera neohumeralis TaxID=98809 RepID=UPI0021659FA6|nr:decapping nuclease DXO homolog isoform X1 [Bactrocera neohumeralis]